jgi:peptide/nickel transport system substrate-binding protein
MPVVRSGLRTWATFVLLASAAACSTAPSPAAPGARRVVRIAIGADEGSLQPYTYVSGYPGWNLLTLVYDTLFVLDEDNQPRPWVARQHDVAADGLAHTLHLRSDVRWHDGQALTSADVRFSFDYYRRHPHGRWSSAVQPIARIDTPDSATVVLHTDAAYPSITLRLLADVPIVPEHLWRSVDAPKTMTSIVGSGPFVLAEHQPDRLYRLTANRDHFSGAPAVDELLLPVVTDPATAFAGLASGELHATSRELPPELLARFSGRPDVTVARGPGFATTLLQFNTERAPWTDARVRRAVALGIDTRRLVDTVLLGQGTPGNPGWLHPTFADHDQAVQPEYAPDEARALLDAAGLRDHNGDGVREFNGQRLGAELLVQANQPSRIRAAELIASSMKAIGIDVRVRAEEGGSLGARVWPDFDVARGRSYDWTMFGWSAPVMVDPQRIIGLVDSDPRVGTNNIGGFRSREADRLSSVLRTSPDAAERRRTLRALEALIARERPFVLLWYADLAYAYRPAAYAGWRFQAGQGILHKRSFVGPPAD